MKAVWNDKVIAESEHTINVEGNQYFPPDSVNHNYLNESKTQSVCPWKGTASYHDVVVEGKTNPDAAWYYPAPSSVAQKIKGYIAFWNGVAVIK